MKTHMNRKTGAWCSLALLAALAMGPQQAALAGPFGLPSMGGGSSSGGGDVGAQVTNFIQSAALSNALVAQGAVQMLQAVSSQERGAELQTMLDALGSVSDPKEKAAQAAKLVSSLQAETATQMQSQQTQDELKQASVEKRRAFTRGLLSSSLGLLKLADLKSSGQGIMSGVSRNPMDAVKVVPVKDTLPLMTELMSNGKTIVDSALTLARAAGIQAKLPTSSSATISDNDLPGK